MGNAADSAENPTQTTISYTYDSLYRLTDAVYSNGFDFHYTYDPVGHRLSQTTCAPDVPCSTTTYGYDAANRLASVNGQAYKWDNNGNLLNDGTSTYVYDSQNRLKTLTQAGHSYAFSYSGDGDRLTQSVDGAVTRYTLDIEGGLTQVLSDGDHDYLYGVDRLAQVNTSETDYFLGDALGSVRQLVDVGGAMVLAENYDPFGNVIARVGSANSAYGFDGESQDSGLVYLRARTYSSAEGRFLSEDPSAGDPQQPMSFNAWLFTYGDPTNLVDRDGAHPCSEALLLPLGEHEGDFYRWCTGQPDVAAYDEMVEPWNITFVGQDLESPTYVVPPKHINAINSDVGRRAQFITGWGHDNPITDFNKGLCGEAALAAILGIPLPDVVEAFRRNVGAGHVTRGWWETSKNQIIPIEEVVYDKSTSQWIWGVADKAGHIVTRYDENIHWQNNLDPTDTPVSELTDFVNSEYSANWYIDKTKRKLADWGGWPVIRDNWLAPGLGYPVADGMVNGSTGQLRYRQATTPGPFQQQTGEIIAEHWVVVTGISLEWELGERYQWIRVHNPFDNLPEYDWATDFMASLEVGSVIMVQRK